MLKITFRYRDEYSRWEWREQTCVVNSVEECKRIYGLGVDCDYQIVDIEKVQNQFNFYHIKNIYMIYYYCKRCEANLLRRY